MTVEFRVLNDPKKNGFDHIIEYIPPSTPPTNPAQQLADLETDLTTNEPRFKSTHPFPFPTRQGYVDTHDFVQNYTWKFTPRAKSNTLLCEGSRFQYVIAVPIFIDGTPKDIFYNFHPAASGDPEIVHILEDDPDFFQIV